ncbi:hypothetical protein DES53_102582 [Roseimicrobium gellanilyticum]|uniref:Peptidase C39-like protein n=1 Tax=Roseimicrobium gellanilyticum TaxID=748857 RepID=A0A366HRR8_9BACT|nr:hypothetical protein [Roseimicrobium gellanilyticum]RBP46196.1 hypothetical protein DES53_102582 [Roseimicrobium gellanilyticum]
MKTALLPALLLLSGMTIPAVPLHGQSGSEKASAPAATLLTDMVTGDQLWTATTEQFEQKFRPMGMEWLSPSKEQARFFGKYAVWSSNLGVTEAIVDFQAGKLARVNLAMFTRGDSAALLDTREAFEKRVEEIKTEITTMLGVQPAERGKDGQSAVKAVGWMWVKPPTAYLLEYSYVKELKSRGQDFRPEFIRLRVAEIPKQQGLLASSQPGANGNMPVAKSTLTANVTHESNGDAVIKNVPMVDQGPKGYCAVATTERVFRYYGLNVDQHEMAQIANTSDGGSGTSPTEMFAALEKIEGRMRVRVRAIQKWDMKEFFSMIDDYNREAKRNDKREINLPSGGMIVLADVYGSMDPGSFKVSRTEKDKAGYGKFQRSVVEMIERGVPIMWGVQLGIFKEGDIPQPGGGHMRLIIGYNTKTSEILYSDSWGAEHALKRMPMNEAWTITTGMYYIEPMK